LRVRRGEGDGCDGFTVTRRHNCISGAPSINADIFVVRFSCTLDQDGVMIGCCSAILFSRNRSCADERRIVGPQPRISKSDARRWEAHLHSLRALARPEDGLRSASHHMIAEWRVSDDDSNPSHDGGSVHYHCRCVSPYRRRCSLPWSLCYSLQLI